MELIKEKADAAEHALAMDAQGINGERKILEKDGRDGERVKRVIDNIRQPQHMIYSGYGVQQRAAGGEDSDVVKDMDLVGNYFVPIAMELQKTLSAYESNLVEIEGHMRVIEASAVSQAQDLAAKRAGISSTSGPEDTVRDLADTLHGFEMSILGAAGLVGRCREGVNELVLGR